MDLERIKLVAAVAARTTQAQAQAQTQVPSTSGASAASASTSTSASNSSNSISNSGSPSGRDLSDYGFRIQLGGLAAAAAAAAATSRQIAAANYARSDTSEELNVDGNDEDSNDGSHSTPSVSKRILLGIIGETVFFPLDFLFKSLLYNFHNLTLPYLCHSYRSDYINNILLTN